MDIDAIKGAIAVLTEEKQNTLETLAKSIVSEKSANKKIMAQARIEVMRETNRQVAIINELCSNFDELIKPTKKPRAKE